MTGEQVFAAAAALREFGLAEISAFCDSRRRESSTSSPRRRTAVKPSGEERWRVVDLAAVRWEARRER